MGTPSTPVRSSSSLGITLGVKSTWAGCKETGLVTAGTQQLLCFPSSSAQCLSPRGGMGWDAKDPVLECAGIS